MHEQPSDDVVIDLDVTQETAEDSIIPQPQPQRRRRGNRPPRKTVEEKKDQLSFDRDGGAESSQ